MNIFKSKSLAKFCKACVVGLTGMISIIASMGLIDAEYNGLISVEYVVIAILNLIVGGLGVFAVWSLFFGKKDC